MTDTQPNAEWSYVEVMGHRVHYGRTREVPLAGIVMLEIEVPTRDPEVFECYRYAGSALFGVHPITEEYARRQCARRGGWDDVARLAPPDLDEPIVLAGDADDELN